MKRFLSAITVVFVVVFVLLVALPAFAYVTVRYYNHDSKSYTAKAVCHGTQCNVLFGASRTASVTIQGSSPCRVTLNGNSITLSGGGRRPNDQERESPQKQVGRHDLAWTLAL
ncbi:MAG: hypothetical protein J7M25_12870 [Deltaproteobacteria bacterium]|nr:hypothetical protein [Deltaproteobacteria bacterium]